MELFVPTKKRKSEKFLKTKYNVIVGILIFLMIASIVDLTTAQLSHGDNGGLQNLGHSDPNAPHMPKLGPLPAGVTPAYTFDSHAYLSFRPNPIGIGQSLLINVWTSPGMYHAFYMQGYSIEIRAPDGYRRNDWSIHFIHGRCNSMARLHT